MLPEQDAMKVTTLTMADLMQQKTITKVWTSYHGLRGAHLFANTRAVQEQDSNNPTEKTRSGLRMKRVRKKKEWRSRKNKTRL